MSDLLKTLLCWLRGWQRPQIPDLETHLEAGAQVPREGKGMKTRPCEVCITTTDGKDIEQRDCGKPARIIVNDLPMCAECFSGYEQEGLVESVRILPFSSCNGVGALCVDLQQRGHHLALCDLCSEYLESLS